jgi:hypothetical protein
MATFLQVHFPLALGGRRSACSRYAPRERNRADARNLATLFPLDGGVWGQSNAAPNLRNDARCQAGVVEIYKI